MKIEQKLNIAETQALNIPVVMASIITDIEKQINETKNEQCWNAEEVATKYGKIDAYTDIIDIIKTKYLP
jgi:hypothetical protein